MPVPRWKDVKRALLGLALVVFVLAACYAFLRLFGVDEKIINGVIVAEATVSLFGLVMFVGTEGCEKSKM